jgi:hypothetical protein
MPASFHHFTANVTPNITTKITAERIIRHTGPSVKTHPEFGFLSGTAFVAAGGSGDEKKLRLLTEPLVGCAACSQGSRERQSPDWRF